MREPLQYSYYALTETQHELFDAGNPALFQKIHNNLNELITQFTSWDLDTQQLYTGFLGARIDFVDTAAIDTNPADEIFETAFGCTLNHKTASDEYELANEMYVLLGQLFALMENC